MVNEDVYIIIIIIIYLIQTTKIHIFDGRNENDTRQLKALIEFKPPPMPFVIRRPTPPKHVINIHPQLFQFVFKA